MLKQWAQT